MKTTTQADWGDAVRVAKFRVAKLPDDQYRKWCDLGEAMRRVTNQYWRLWLVWHSLPADPVSGDVKTPSSTLILDYIKERTVWAKAATGDAKGRGPKSPVRPVPKECGNWLYHQLCLGFPEISRTTITLVMDLEQKRLQSRPAAFGSFPSWMRILADDGGFPNSSQAQPIPFSSRSCRLVPPQQDGEMWRFFVKADRQPGDDRPGHCPETEFILETAQRGGKSHRDRKLASQTAILEKIAAGECKLCGSSIVRDKRTKALFAHVAYRKKAGATTMPDLDPKLTIVLMPGRRRPWLLRIDGRTRWVVRDGNFVAHKRRCYLTDRWSYQESYRFAASSSRKGHGEPRALFRLDKLRRGWTAFVKSFNHVVAHRTVDACVAEGVGRLVYIQPRGDKRDTRFLFTAGKVPGRRDATGWDWHQVQAFLAYRCKAKGIELVVRGERSGDAKTPARSRGPAKPSGITGSVNRTIGRQGRRDGQTGVGPGPLAGRGANGAMTRTCAAGRRND